MNKVTAVPTITKEWLEERCTRNEDGCLVWKRYIFVNKGRDVPKARPVKDEQPIQVRRMVWKLKTGRAPARTDHIIRTCDTWGCVEPMCLAKRGPADALKGRKLPLEHRAKIAAAQRAIGRTSLTLEDVRAIRAAETSIDAEAAVRGVGLTTVAEIRRGTRWREYSNNPFSQLLP